MNEIINSDELPAPKGFSHAVRAGNTVYLAGQIGTGTTLVQQFDDAAKNLITALKPPAEHPQTSSASRSSSRTSRTTATPNNNSARHGASTSAAAIRRWACSV